MPIDDRAKVANWYCTDIEKILVEAEVFNPRPSLDHQGQPSKRFQRLPGECLHDTGQNPKQSSSIGETHHTHISRSMIEDWPVYSCLHNNEVWIDELAAYLDIVQVGKEFDSFSLKLRTMHPTNFPILSLLHDLRIELLKKFGENEIDFNVYAGASKTGWFVIIFTPITHQFSTVSERVDPTTIPFVPCMGFSNGKGAVGVKSEAALEYCKKNGFSIITSL